MSSLAAKKAALTEGPIGKTLIKMLLGMLVGHVAMTIFNITDTFFVAQLGTEAPRFASQLCLYFLVFRFLLVQGHAAHTVGVLFDLCGAETVFLQQLRQLFRV